MKTLKWLAVVFFSLAIVANVTSIPFLYAEEGALVEDILRSVGTLALIGGLVCAVFYLRILSLPANDTIFYKMHARQNKAWRFPPLFVRHLCSQAFHDVDNRTERRCAYYKFAYARRY